VRHAPKRHLFARPHVPAPRPGLTLALTGAALGVRLRDDGLVWLGGKTASEGGSRPASNALLGQDAHAFPWSPRCD